MKLLLDTHVWFWALQSTAKLGKACQAKLENPQNSLYVSTISTLELGQLVHTGRIELKGTLDAWVRRGIKELGIETVELSHSVSLLAYSLPGDFHKDPADRIIVASAIEHGHTLVTADERILAYPHAQTLDARE